MKDLQNAIAKIIEKYCGGEGSHKTPIPGVHCIKYSSSDKRSRRHWRACLGLVIQGCKEVALDGDVYRAADLHYTTTPVDLPVISRVATASKEKPLLGLLIDFNSVVISELDQQLQKIDDLGEGESRAIFVGKASERMLETALRLARLLETPDEAAVLGPILIRELFYYLLKTPNGQGIRQFVRSGSAMQRVAKAIHKIQSELEREVNVPELARYSNMSRSAFFKSFKEATSMSPIQYQKRLRLLEARRLMTTGETAERAAYQVGYRSPSQFSREYSRMFGNAPLRDVSKLKKTETAIRPI